MTTNRWIVAAGVAFAVGVMAPWAEGEARASSKEECLEAHGRGQDLRDAGRLTSARQAFLTCAQNSCPSLIESDCARFGEELERLVPSVSFAARDSSGGDLPDTAVYVDDQPVAMRLDDGKAYDLDPGRHTVRFVHEGRDSTVTLVLTEGEKGRSVVATFADLAAAPRATPEVPRPIALPRRAKAPLVIAAVGATAAVTGVVLAIVGLHEVPGDCSIATHQCVAAPGDPSFAQAHRGIALADAGIGVGIAGAATLAAGAIAYFAQPLRASTELGALTPWIGARSGGLSLRARF